MRTVWIDASAGASGDMLLGALVDAGVPLTVLQSAIDHLGLGIGLRAEPVRRSALGATKVHVDVPEPRTLRHLPEVLAELAKLPADLAEATAEVFTRLADAEAAVHRIDRDEVHFHEVGALDCLADIVAAIAGFRHLDPDHVACSTIGLGRGFASTEHGEIPVPVPAVLELVAGVPAEAGPAPFEATTPTGAALLVSLADSWSAMPPMQIAATGSGAGTRDPESYANIVRVIVGEADGAAITDRGAMADEAARQIDANIDDIDPRLLPATIEALLAAGAHDAWVTPIIMKKGRAAFTLSVLFDDDPDTAHRMRDLIVANTSTIGMREHQVTKFMLDRSTTTVTVRGETIRVKVAHHRGRVVNRSIEWDDVAAAAATLGVAAKQVLAEATALAHDLRTEPGAPRA